MLQPDWAPSVADVGTVLRARTIDTNGNELGTFTEDTRPTGEQVADEIESVVGEIHADVGDIPDLIQDAARRVAKIGAACSVELSYFPEQINSGQSPYPQLEAKYQDLLKRLAKAVADANDDGVLNDDELLMPEFYFDVCTPIVGNRTQW
jgi:hypothetical protein